MLIIYRNNEIENTINNPLPNDNKVTWKYKKEIAKEKIQ